MAKLTVLEVASITVLVLATLAASGTLQLVLALTLCAGALLGWAMWPLRELPPRGSSPPGGRGRALRSSAGRRSRG
jgi:hypothetical protein